MRVMRLAILSGVLFALGGCGGVAYVMLEIPAALSIPDEADHMEIVTLDVESGSELTRLDLDLASPKRFPLDILLELDDSAPAHLREEVRVTRNGVLVAVGAVEHNWHANRTTRVKLPPLHLLW